MTEELTGYLNEVNPFTLVGRREATATPTAHHARFVDPDAAGRVRAQHRATLEGGDGLAAQKARQLDPLCPSNARASLYELCRHYDANRSPHSAGLAVRHHHYMQPGLSYRVQRDTRPGICLRRHLLRQ